MEIEETINDDSNSSTKSNNNFENDKSNIEQINDKPKFARQRNRSRSNVVIRKQITKSNVTLDDLSPIVHRNRSSTDYCIQPDLEKKNSIFEFKPIKPKSDKCNLVINEYYEKMKLYYNQDFINPLELLNLKFYIRSVIPIIIKFYKIEPELTFLQKHELSLFIVNDILYCKLYKLNKFEIKDYEINNYNRFMTSIKNLPNKNIYVQYLENFNCDKEFKCDDINKGSEILAAWDKERLFDHIVINNYIMRENYKYKWPKIKNVDFLDKIKPKELLDKFWKFSIIDNLSKEDYLSKLDQENIELIISSIIFLLGEIKNPEQIKSLRILLLDLYKKLSIINNDEKLYYECAKYATFLELYIEAWDHIHKCNISLHCKTEDIIWLKQLKIYYLCYLMKKSSNNDLSIAKNYIDVGNFTKIINDLEGNNDLSNTLELADHYLEGLLCLYHHDEKLVIDEINKWTPEIIFVLSCTAYCRSDLEKHNEKFLLMISQICLELLNRKSYYPDKDCLIQISKKDNQSYLPINESSKIIITMKFDLLFNFAKLFQLISETQLSQLLYLKSFELLCQIDNYLSVINFYIKYENNIINHIIRHCTNSEIPNISNIALMNLCQILIERKYMTDSYIYLLKYIMNKNSYVMCYKLMIKIKELIPIITTEYKELFDKIHINYSEITNYKEILSNSLLIVINIICDNKENNFLINNWINECFILDKTQYMLMVKSKNILSVLKD